MWPVAFGPRGQISALAAKEAEIVLNSYKVTVFLSLMAIFLAGVFVMAGPVRVPGDNRGYAPTQPIKYSHRLHAGVLGIDCMYCHTGVERSKQATVPSAFTCMNCHKFVQNKDENGKPSSEIMKIYAAQGLDESGQRDPKIEPKPIEWIKVHDMPDFVRFNHGPHISAGVECFTCHGQIQEQDTVKQTERLMMGQCINCHREANHSGVKGKKVNARLDCSTCHY